MTRLSFLLGALVAGAAGLTQDAAAATLERTAPLVTVDDGLGGFNAHAGDTFTAATGGATFTDLFTFDVATPFDAAASLTSAYLNSPQTKDLAITAFSLYRYDPATGTPLGTAIAGIDESGFGPNPTDSWSLAAYGLPGGAYAIRIDGTVSGAGGGAFGADVAISPVPEPQAWGLLAGGLGMLAWRRRVGAPPA